MGPISSLFRSILIPLLMILVLSPLLKVHGTMVLPLDLAQMTQSAGKIFVGRCLEMTQGLDENGMPATYVRFDILRGVKGVETGEKLLIKQYGIQKEPLYVREGERAIVPMKSMTVSGKGYLSGVEYLLFFYPESSLGFTSPVGGGQGKFEILSGEKETRLAINPLGNRFLKGFSVFPAGGGAIDLDQIVDRVQGLVDHAK